MRELEIDSSSSLVEEEGRADVEDNFVKVTEL
jgi:hypothetical protein